MMMNPLPPSPSSTPSPPGNVPTANLALPRHVMVVDDEAALVSLMADMLVEAGCAVSGFHDPLQALRCLQDAPQTIDFLVLDAMMPGMTGLELAAQARHLRPDLGMLLISGHSDPWLAQHAHRVGIAEVLCKPVGTAELPQAIARIWGAGQDDTLKQAPGPDPRQHHTAD